MTMVHLAAGAELDIASREELEQHHNALLEAVRRLKDPAPVYRRLSTTFAMAANTPVNTVVGPQILDQGPPMGHIWLIQTVLFTGDYPGLYGLAANTQFQIALYLGSIPPFNDGSTMVWGASAPANEPYFYSFSRDDLLVRSEEKIWAAIRLNSAGETVAAAAKLEINVLELPDNPPRP